MKEYIRCNKEKSFFFFKFNFVKFTFRIRNDIELN